VSRKAFQAWRFPDATAGSSSGDAAKRQRDASTENGDASGAKKNAGLRTVYGFLHRN